MTDTAVPPPRRFLNPWRIAGWGTMATLLSIPALFDFPWSPGDFVVMGILLGSVGLGIEFLVRRSGSAFVRLGAIVGVLTCFLTIWVNLAVGMIGSENNPYNQLFLFPILIFIAGTFVTKFQPRGMTYVLLAAAAVQLLLGAGGLGTDLRGARFSMIFSLFWLFGAGLFRAGWRR
jgi:hypothetical protein